MLQETKAKAQATTITLVIGLAGTIFGAMSRDVFNYVLVPLADAVFPRITPIGYLALLIATTLLSTALTACYFLFIERKRIIKFNSDYEFEEDGAFITIKGKQGYWCPKCLVKDFQEIPLKMNDSNGVTWECVHCNLKYGKLINNA